jgi:hypothetical protein
VPPEELVVRSELFTRPEPVSEIVELAVKLLVPELTVLSVPLREIAPVLLIIMLPVFCEMPVMVKGAAVFVSEILPAPVLVALKLLIVLAEPSVVPPTELVIKVGPESTPL